MPWKAKKVAAALEKKGFRRNERHHHYFFYWTIDGRLTSVKTYTSHSEKEINDSLENQMARQCCLKTSQFRDLLNCPLTREGYERILDQLGKLL